MGRKIPGRKHRGIKDPEKQRQIRLNSLKGKINLPPTDPDEQHVPKSLVRLMELKERTTKGEFNNKRRRKRKPEDFKLRRHKFDSEKPTPIFKRSKGESEQDFMRRVNRVCEETIKEAEFENKYGVDVKRNVQTGKVEAVIKRSKRDVGDTSTNNNQSRLTKVQKRRKKLAERKEKRALLKRDEFEDYKDEVKFGEVVQAPPSLTAPKRAQKDSSTPRPGMKDLLLKKTLMGNSNTNKTAKVIDRKGKRKELPNALRRHLDKQHEEVILAYKKLKAQKYSAGK